MNRIKKLAIIFMILAFSAVELFASGHNRAGTSAAPELRIPIGARYLALGGSQISSVEGLESIYWNPAGLDFTKANANAIFSYRSYIADMNMDFIGVSGRLHGLGSVGLTFRSLNIGSIDVTTMDQPDGTGATFTPTFFIVGLSYSKKLTTRISVGTNLNVISESFDRAKATGISFDMGVQYRELFDVSGLSFGVVIKNLGSSMKYDGNGLFKTANDPDAQRGPTYYKIDAQSADMPSEFSIGLAYLKKFGNANNASFSFAFQNNNYTYDNYKLGLELSHDNWVFLRAGYLYSPQATSDAPNIFQNYTLGFGLNLKKVTHVNMTLDYAFIPVKYFKSNNVFSISFGF